MTGSKDPSVTEVYHHVHIHINFVLLINFLILKHILIYCFNSQMKRVWTLVDENTLTCKMWMATSTNTELTEHLFATYTKTG